MTSEAIRTLPRPRLQRLLRDTARRVRNGAHVDFLDLAPLVFAVGKSDPAPARRHRAALLAEMTRQSEELTRSSGLYIDPRYSVA